jgi:hypothetical protein
MKNISLFILLITGMALTQCSSQKEVVQKNVPFSITEKFYQNWVGGKEGSSGTYLKIKGDIKPSTVQFVSVFFHNREQKVNAMFQNGTFTIESNFFQKKDDMNMTGDPAQEYGNKVPVADKDEDFPFELKDNEAVLYYNVSGKDYYYKIVDIKKLENRIFE